MKAWCYLYYTLIKTWRALSWFIGFLTCQWMPDVTCTLHLWWLCVHYRVLSGSLPANECLMLPQLHLSWLGMHYRVLSGSLPAKALSWLGVHYRVLSGFLPANESLILPVLHLSWLGVRYRVLSGSLPANESLHDVTCTTLIMTRRALLCFIGLLTCQWKPDVSLTTLIMTGRASLKANVLPALGQAVSEELPVYGTVHW